MLPTHQFTKSFTDKALAGYLSHAGDYLADEAKVIGETAEVLMNAGMQLNNKNLVICLVKALECTDDVIEADIIRNALEIVMGYTPDDLSSNDHSVG